MEIFNFILGITIFNYFLVGIGFGMWNPFEWTEYLMTDEKGDTRLVGRMLSTLVWPIAFFSVLIHGFIDKDKIPPIKK